MATSYSQKELTDKDTIEYGALLKGSDIEKIRDLFSTYDYNWYSYPIGGIAPPVRCSDGKRRGFLDYIDFLFPEPSLEELVEMSAANTEFKLRIDVNEQSICMNVAKRQPVAEPVSEPVSEPVAEPVAEPVSEPVVQENQRV